MLLRTLLAVMLAAGTAFSQTAPAPEQVIEQVTPSVATVLVGDASGNVNGVGTAVVVREDGVLLTAYHVVKNAEQVQVKFKNGEAFDDVELLGVDKRRDVAALRISAGNLPTLPTAHVADIKPGETTYAVSQARALPWTVSSGVISAIRLADEVPGAGTGYRLVQFTAPIAPGSSGGLVVDANGRLIGIVVGTVTGAQNMNFAVPVESVLGLASAEPQMAFRAGTRLQLPNGIKETPKLKEGVDVEGPEKSDVIASRDPNVIMKKLRTIAVKTKTVWVKDEVVKNALRNRPELIKMGISIVDDPRLADAVVTTDRVLFTWDFTYRLVHQNTSIILASGKFTRIDGITAANAFADDIAEKFKAVRMPSGEKKQAESKKPEPKEQQTKQ